MTRPTITPAVEAELSKEKYRLLILGKLNFPSAPVFAHTGVGDIEFNGDIYKGVGKLGNIEVLEESTELKTFGFALELSGIDSALISVSLNDDIQGKSAELWLMFLDESYQPIPDPVGPWAGRMDVMSSKLDKTATIRLEIESRLAAWERALIRRYTDADQQTVYPGDLFFEFTSQMQEKEIIWGPAPK